MSEKYKYNAPGRSQAEESPARLGPLSPATSKKHNGENVQRGLALRATILGRLQLKVSAAQAARPPTTPYHTDLCVSSEPVSRDAIPHVC